MRKRGEGGGRSRKKDWGGDEEGRMQRKRWKEESETNEEDGRRIRKKPEEGGRIWKKGDEGGMFSESVEIRRNLTCYGWLSQPATQNTKTW